jgi:hypothetical protein
LNSPLWGVSKEGSFWLCLIQSKSPKPKSLGGVYEKEIAKGAIVGPPKRKINLFGGSLDIYTADYAGRFSIIVWHRQLSNLNDNVTVI